MDERIFEVTQEVGGVYCAECLTEATLTQGDAREELRENVREAVAAFYLDHIQPAWPPPRPRRA